MDWLSSPRVDALCSRWEAEHAAEEAAVREHAPTLAFVYSCAPQEIALALSEIASDLVPRRSGKGCGALLAAILMDGPNADNRERIGDELMRALTHILASKAQDDVLDALP